MILDPPTISGGLSRILTEFFLAVTDTTRGTEGQALVADAGASIVKSAARTRSPRTVIINVSPCVGISRSLKVGCVRLAVRIMDEDFITSIYEFQSTSPSAPFQEDCSNCTPNSLVGVISASRRSPRPTNIHFPCQILKARPVHIGETDQLRHRFQHRRAPGPTQPTNIRLRDQILKHIGDGKPIEVSIVAHAVISVDGATRSLDLSKKSSRSLLESAELSSARLAGVRAENL
jgi:hypothetical protein